MEKDRINLINMNFKSLPKEQKRAALVVMDIAMKKLHNNGHMITNFDPNHIYFENEIYFFDNTYPISTIVANNKEEAILNNLIWMADVALWAYSDSDIMVLLSPSYLSKNFDSFAYIYPPEDREYYKSILVDSYQSGKIATNTPYFSDYVVSKHKNNRNNVSQSVLVKATEAGKKYDKEYNSMFQDQTAFGNTFFLITVVTSLTIILIGIIAYFCI